MEQVVAIDLGGTKLASAIIDATGHVDQRAQIAVKRRDPSVCIGQIVDAVTRKVQAAQSAELHALGIIVPGIYFADTGDVWAPNLWGDERVPLKQELEMRLGLPVVIDNDRAGCVAGEQWRGIARGLRDVVFVTVGTGIGAGIISGGRLLRGASGIAGAAGWFALNPDVQDLYKKVGCWEAESAGPALARHAQMASAEEVVAAAARRSEPPAIYAVERAAKYLGMGIANIVSLLNPEMVVLGGGLMQAADLFLETIKRGVREWAQPLAARQVRITVSELGGDAGLLGAARIAFDTIPV